jgi:hypothetical protein
MGLLRGNEEGVGDGSKQLIQIYDQLIRVADPDPHYF